MSDAEYIGVLRKEHRETQTELADQVLMVAAERDEARKLQAETARFLQQAIDILATENVMVSPAWHADAMKCIR